VANQLDNYPTEVPNDIAYTKDAEKTEAQEFIQDRLAFTRKVLGIVSFQLLVSMGMCVCASYFENFGYYCQQWWMVLISVVSLIFAVIPLYILRTKVPVNYILLMVMTMCEAMLFCSLTAMMTTESVLLSCGVLAVTVSTLFAGALICPSIAKLLIMLVVAAVVGCVVQMCMLIYLFKALWLS